MTSFIHLLLMAALPIQLLTTDPEPPQPEATYCNQIFEFCSQFPSDDFPTRLELNDGILLRTENDLATVTILGQRDFHGENTQIIFENEVKKQAGPDERTVLISSLFGEDFYECFFLVGHKTYYHKAFLSDGKLVRLTIETAINQPKLMQELRDNVSLFFPEKEEVGVELTERE